MIVRCLFGHQKSSVSLQSFPQTDPGDPHRLIQAVTHLSASSCAHAGELPVDAAWWSWKESGIRGDGYSFTASIRLQQMEAEQPAVGINEPCSCDAG